MVRVAIVDALNYIVQSTSRNIHIAIWINGNILGRLVSGFKRGSLLRSKQNAVAIKRIRADDPGAIHDHHLIVIRVSDVYIAEKIGRNTKWTTQLRSSSRAANAGATLACWLACARECPDDAGWIHDANLISALVGDVNVAAHIQFNSCGEGKGRAGRQAAVPAAGSTALAVSSDRGDNAGRGVHFANHEIIAVRDIYVAGSIYTHAIRSTKSG